ncbi:hypothetical protein HY631_04235 [Candidatus Uhrbacteria bacterium]|nr:hypothetical protein [Candidatus Uhrbacteria bacterium]
MYRLQDGVPHRVLSFGDDLDKIPHKIGDQTLSWTRAFPDIVGEANREEYDVTFVGLCRVEGELWVVYFWSLMLAGGRRAKRLTVKETDALNEWLMSVTIAPPMLA